jgi:hypothetical protein
MKDAYFDINYSIQFTEKAFLRYIYMSCRRYNFGNRCNFDTTYILDAHDWINNQRSLILNYSPHQILNSDHCSFQQEYTVVFKIIGSPSCKNLFN